MYEIKEGKFEGRYPLDIVLIMGTGEYNIVIPSYIGTPRVASRIIVYQKGDNRSEIILSKVKFRKRWWFGYERRDFRILGLKPNIISGVDHKWLEAMFLEVKEI